MCLLQSNRRHAKTGPGVAWLAIALLSSCAPCLRVGATELTYSVVAVPLPPVAKPLLNDKGQVLTVISNTAYMYLPTADYGLEAGVHPRGAIAEGAVVVDFNKNGHFVTHGPGNEAWLYKDGAVFNFLAFEVAGLDQLGRVLMHYYDYGQAVFPAISEVDGSVTPGPGPNGLSGQKYHFWDINDAGIAVGQTDAYFDDGSRWHAAIWNTKSGASQILPTNSLLSAALLVNNKSQIFGYRWFENGSSALNYIYLPTPDYGLPAGFTDLPETTASRPPFGLYDARLTDRGEIYIGGSQNPTPTSIWYQGQMINPADHIVGTNTATITRIFDINNHGSILATGTLNGQPGKLFILNPFLSDFFITAPARDEIVPPDEPYTIRFEAPTNITSVNLYLVTNSLSSGGPRTLIAENVPAAAGTNVWDVPAELLSPSTFVIAVDSADATTETISARFRVRKPWWLYRVAGSFQEPEYRYFNRTNAFSFLPQDEERMWDALYWDRHEFDYAGGFDPFIGSDVHYHPAWFGDRIEPEYPPWSAMVRAFGMPGTYTSPLPWTIGGVVWNQPNPEAALWWNWYIIKDGTYGGVCYGLSMAMMAAFQDPKRFDQKWLPSGGSANLASLDLGPLGARDEVLNAVHALHLYQIGRLQQAEWGINESVTPREVVSRLKAMFERDDRDRDRFLLIKGYVDVQDENGNYRYAGHAVVPIYMTREDDGDTEEGLYAVAIVDPNYGPNRAGKDNPRFIWIHTGENWWSHDDSLWRGDTNTGIYLSMEVIRAFEPASTQWAHVLDGNGNPLPAMVKAAGDAEPDTFSVSIIGRGGAVTSGVGELRYEGGVLTETLPGGFISFPITGRASDPDAYVVPSGVSYRAEAIPRADGIAGVRVSGGAVTASILQTGAASPTRAVVDLLEDGLSVVSGGPGTFELTALTLANGREFRSLRASGLVATNPASLGLTADAGGFRLTGTAEASSYHLELNSSTGNVSRVFHHPNLLLEAGATHWIRPNWATLGEGHVTIDVDRDGDGQTDETLVVANQAPSTSIWPGWVGGTPPGNPNLLTQNHGFESQPLGTSVSLPPVVADGTTFTGWRVFNVDTNSVAFSATLIAHASIGTRAMRLGVTNTSGTAGHALDQWVPAMHTTVQLGTRYLVSFDAAWIAGLTTGNLLFQVQEFDSAGGYLGNGLSTLRSVSTTAYEKHTFIYQPVNPATAGIGMFFGPLRGVVGATTISLDNVRMVVAPLLVNGDFESSPPATSAGGNGVFVDTTTFLGWRLFSVGSPPITNLTATIVDAGGYTGGQPGSRALRLAVTNTGSPAAHDYGLDNDNARSPVVTGRKYTLSFDAALLQVSGGSLTLNVSVAEFNAAGSFTGTQGSFAPALIADETFHRHSMTYVVTNPATTKVVIAFRPVTTGQSTLVLDNVEFAPFVADTPTSLTIDVNGATLSLTWPESHLGWRVQSNSVNLANPSAWFDIPGSQSVTNLSLPISPTAPAVYYRLRRP